MHSVRSLVMGCLLCVGGSTVFPAVSFAHAEHTQADLKLLKDAAVALQQSRPDLAAALTTYAAREEHELKDMTTAQHEQEERGEKTEPANERKENAPY